MSFRQKAIAALENAELVDGLANTEVVETVPATAPEVEAGAAEIVEQVAEVEDLNVAAEEAEADATALSDVAEVMEESVESGEGLTEQTAEMAEIAVESISARLGFSRSQRTIPALESFGTTGSRLAATKVALENLSDKLKRTWQAILNFLKMIWDKIKSFVAGLLKSRSTLQKHIESLIGRADALKGDVKPKEETLKGGIAKVISIDGKADLNTAKTILDDAKRLLNFSVAMSGKIAGVAGGLASAADIAAKTGDLSTSLKTGLDGLDKVSPKNGEEGYSYHGHIVGGRTIGYKTEEKDGVTSTKLTVAQHGNNAEAARALSVAEVKELLKEALAAVKDLQKFDKVEKDLAGATKKAIETVQKLASAADKTGEEEGEENRKAATAMRDLTNVISKLSVQFPAFVFGSCKACADYASASLGNLKGADAEPAKK